MQVNILQLIKKGYFWCEMIAANNHNHQGGLQQASILHQQIDSLQVLLRDFSPASLV
jgi:hypothetical protein